MAFKVHNVLLLSLVALLFFNSNAAAPQLSEVNDVKHNEEVQELGRFTLEEANKKVSDSSEKMTFGEVVSAKFWSVTDGVRYFFVINSMKGGQTEGSFLGYLVVSDSSNERIPLSWSFQPIGA